MSLIVFWIEILYLVHSPQVELRFIRILRAPNSKKRKPIQSTKAYLVSWGAKILTLNTWPRSPQACRFMVLILLFIPSGGPAEIGTSR
jgi:hypothetical protein